MARLKETRANKCVYIRLGVMGLGSEAPSRPDELKSTEAELLQQHAMQALG